MSIYDVNPEDLAALNDASGPVLAPRGTTPMAPQMPESDWRDIRVGNGFQAYPGQADEIPTPHDFFTRLAEAQGPNPVHFQSRNPNAAEVILGLAAAFGNFKTASASNKAQDIEKQNERVRQSARDLALHRYQLKRQRELASAISTRQAANQQAITDRQANKPEGGLTPEFLATHRQGPDGKWYGVKDPADAQRQTLAESNANRRARVSQVSNARGLANEYRQDPDVSGYIGIRDSYNVAADAATKKNSAGDIVLMRMVAKMTDPTTGVREEEFRTFQGAQGSLARRGVQLTSDMVGAGQLTTQGRERLLEIVNGIHERKLQNYRGARDFYSSAATDMGEDPKRSIRDYEMRTGTTPSPSASGRVVVDGFRFPNQAAADGYLREKNAKPR